MLFPEICEIKLKNQLDYDGINITFNGEAIDDSGEGAQVKVFMRPNQHEDSDPYFVCSVPAMEILKLIPILEKLK